MTLVPGVLAVQPTAQAWRDAGVSFVADKSRRAEVRQGPLVSPPRVGDLAQVGEGAAELRHPALTEVGGPFCLHLVHDPP